MGPGNKLREKGDVEGDVQNASLDRFATIDIDDVRHSLESEERNPYGQRNEGDVEADPPPPRARAPRRTGRGWATKRIRAGAVTATAKSAFARADRDSALDTPRATNQLTKMERIITKTKRG